MSLTVKGFEEVKSHNSGEEFETKGAVHYLRANLSGINMQN